MVLLLLEHVIYDMPYIVQDDHQRIMGQQTLFMSSLLYGANCTHHAHAKLQRFTRLNVQIFFSHCAHKLTPSVLECRFVVFKGVTFDVNQYSRMRCQPRTYTHSLNLHQSIHASAPQSVCMEVHK